MTKFHATILSIFPEMFPGALGYSLAKKAMLKNIWSYDVINIKDFGLGRHQKIDDEAYGGASGLVMRADVLGSALDYALKSRPDAKILYPSPRGQKFSQNMAKEIIKYSSVIILCGRYEGIDERVIQEYNAAEISIGDYILSGGELAALTILDSCIRLLPGVLENQDTLQEESFEKDIGLEYPLYTRPDIWRERSVPEVLKSGNHSKIQQWRKLESYNITKKRRPDLLKS